MVTNRTIRSTRSVIGLETSLLLKFKRTQGTQAGRKEGVAPILKLFSLDTYLHIGGDSVVRLVSNMGAAVKGKVVFDLSGSKRMASWERDVRNLGGTHCLPSSHDARVGGSTNRSEPRWLWVADRLTCRAGQVACKPASRPDLCRSGRRHNVARKGNMGR